MSDQMKPDQTNSGQPESEPPKPARPASGRAGFSAARIAAIAALLGAVIFVCVNIISSQVLRGARIDLTQQHLYSLSQGTRTLLGEIKEPLRFRMFMSGALTKQAPQLAAFAARVRALLDAYVAASNGRIILEVIDPRPFSEDEDRAVAYGIQSFQGTGGEQLFFGLAATNSTTGRSTISVFAPDRETFLEYDLTRMVSQLGNRGKPVVALIDGLGLAGSPQMRAPEQQTLAQMRQFFDVQMAAPDKLPDQARVLMVVHPLGLTDAMLYNIDQWVLAGKPAIFFVDPFAENQLPPGGMPGMPPTRTASTLEPLFKAWGVKFDTSQVVGDPTYALQTQRNVGGRPVVSQNLPWMALRGDALTRDEAILAQLSAIVLTNAGALETTKDGVTLRPLLTASGNAVLIDAAIASDRNADPRRMLSGMKRPDKPPVLAARLSGTLDSAYPDGPPGSAAKAPAAADAPPAEAAANAETSKLDASKPETSKPETIKRSVKPINVILVGDADMLMDRNWIQQQNLLGQQIAQAFANNGDFVINALEQMSGGAALSDLRGRGVSWRPFEVIQQMEAEADQRFRAKEQQLTQELKDTEQKLAEMPRAPEGSNDVLTPEQMQAVDGFRAQLLSIRSELRDVQFALRRNVDDLKSWITAVNVGVVPLVVAIIALIFAMRRPRRPVPVKEGRQS